MTQTLIWDLDGTLIDSYAVFLTALSKTFAAYHLPFDREKVYSFIKTRSVKEFLQNQPFAFEKLKAAFTEESAARNSEIKLIEGAQTVLAWTKEKKIRNFIYTHKGRKNAEILLKQLSISSFFTEVVTSENAFPRKPNPAALDYLCEKYELNRASTYYIGDRSLDFEAANRSGIQSINFLSAPGSQQIQQLTDIIPLLEKNNG